MSMTSEEYAAETLFTKSKEDLIEIILKLSKQNTTIAALPKDFDIEKFLDQIENENFKKQSSSKSLKSTHLFNKRRRASSVSRSPSPAPAPASISIAGSSDTSSIHTQNSIQTSDFGSTLPVSSTFDQDFDIKQESGATLKEVLKKKVKIIKEQEQQTHKFRMGDLLTDRSVGVQELIEMYESKPQLLSLEFIGEILCDVIQLSPDRIDFVSYLLKTPGIPIVNALEQAYLHKNHRLIRMLTFYQMDLKMRQQIDSYAKKRNESLGLINALDDFLQERFLKKSHLNQWQRNPKGFDEFMHVLEDMLIFCVEKTYPISQDILLLVWHYQENFHMSHDNNDKPLDRPASLKDLAEEAMLLDLSPDEQKEYQDSQNNSNKSKKKDDLLETPLWKCIENKLSSILEREVSDSVKAELCTKMRQQVDWHWFEKNWLNSVLWLEKIYPKIVSAKSLHLERSTSPHLDDINELGDPEMITAQPSLIDDTPLLTRNLDRLKLFQAGLFTAENKAAQAKQGTSVDPEQPKLLYLQLMKIGDAQLEKVRKELSKEMKVLIEKHPQDWKAIVQYRPETTSERDDPRQDTIEGGIQSTFSFKELSKLTALSQSFDSEFSAEFLYDYRTYLSQAILTAHFLNQAFQNDVSNAFHSAFSDVLCQAGPVKTMERCAVKGFDYRNREFPTSAHILDLVRTSVTFKNVKDYWSAIQFFIKYVEDNRHKQSIKNIVRIKNGFVKFDVPRTKKVVTIVKTETGETKQETEVTLTEEEQLQMLINSNVNQYVDLKMNVHISYQNRNLIGEIQFLLQPILETQQKCHRLYELVRVRELLDYCDHINFAIEEELQVAVEDPFHFVEIMVTKPVEAKYMLTHEPLKIKVIEQEKPKDEKKDDVKSNKENNDSGKMETREVMKAVCCNTHNETSQTVVNTLLWEVLSIKNNSNSCRSVIIGLISKYGKEIDWNFKDRNGCSVLHHASTTADKDMLDVMCREIGQKHIERFFNATDKQGRTPWMLALGKPRKKFIRHLLDKYYKYMNWSTIDSKGDNVLHYILSYCDDEILRMVVPYIDPTQLKKIINAPNQMGETPLMSGCKNAILDNQVRTIQLYCQQFGNLIDWNQKNKFDRNYLHFPVIPSVMQCLTQAMSREQCNLFFKTPDNAGDTPLMRAATRGHMELVKFITDNFDIDTKLNELRMETSPVATSPVSDSTLNSK